MYQCVNTMIHRSFRAATSAELARRGETGDTPNDAIEVTLLHLTDYLATLHHVSAFDALG